MDVESLGDSGAADIQAVARVGQIFSLFSPTVTDVTASEVAGLLGLNRTTAYRYCTSLAAAGLLERGARRGSFALGGVMLQIGTLALGRRAVVELAPKYLSVLSEETQHTAVLSLWGSSGPVVTLVEEYTKRAMLITARTGITLDADTAQTKVFLAWQSAQFSISLVTNDFSATQHATLEHELASIRSDGLSIVNTTDGLAEAAAPVFDRYGICASVALLGTNQLADFELGSHAMTMLASTAASLSELAGGRS